MPPASPKKGTEVAREIRSGQDGATSINEVSVTLDEPILDPRSPLAVQIPEDSDADRSKISNPLADALADGHVEAKFGTVAAPLPSGADADPEDEHIRAVGDDSGKEFKPDADRVETPETHSEPEVIREAAASAEDAKDSKDSKASKK